MRSRSQEHRHLIAQTHHWPYHMVVLVVVVVVLTSVPVWVCASDGRRSDARGERRDRGTRPLASSLQHDETSSSASGSKARGLTLCYRNPRAEHTQGPATGSARQMVDWMKLAREPGR
jgi:hypothetical protein